ncbi:hypothetical protein [Novosphingobium sp. Leaf2]|uniref:hypothetical protein n=1 Tax=Novosphingobium sp. Leaf2 TaxID=1735670 RepID=UPI0006F90891|nr:hypothetical protein [Novosphingobium sp. Leaf2]KQM17559.1 hypothetical protein ASE49_10720 [Novosphingobium sp. Leaf2]
MSNTDTKTFPAKSDSTKPANIAVLPTKLVEERPSEKVIAFVKRHPVLTVTAGLAAGALVSSLVPRRVSRKAGKRAAHLAEVAAATGKVFGRRASDRVHDAGVVSRKQAAILADHASKASDRAAHKLEKYGIAAAAAASAFGRAAAKRASKFGDVAADAAGHLGDAAAARSTKVVDLAEELKTRIKR